MKLPYASGFPAKLFYYRSLRAGKTPLRDIVNVPAMPQPEAYIADASGLIDDNGNLTKESTKEFLRKFMEAFAKGLIRMRRNSLCF